MGWVGMGDYLVAFMLLLTKSKPHLKAGLHWSTLA